MRNLFFLTLFLIPGLLHAGTFSDQDTATKYEWKHYGPFEAAAGDFVSQLTVEGDADLYVRKNAEPTTYRYDCRPYKGGSITEFCTFNVTETTQVFVGING